MAKASIGIVTALTAIVVAVAGCSGADDTLQVGAAASLARPFDALTDDYGSREDVPVELNTAASSALVQQIDAGSGPDVLATADVETMERVTDDYDVFAANDLVLAVSADDADPVNGLADLEEPGRTVAVCASEVPCGRVADRVLAAAGVTPATATREPDATATVSKLVLGEVDAALVYGTDVLANEDDLVAVEGALRGVPPEVARTEYAISALEPSGDAFVEFVLGPEGRAQLRRQGFLQP